MALEMLKYNYSISSSNFSLDICEEFIDGYYFPTEKKIVMCSNMLTNFEKSNAFNIAIKRFVSLLFYIIYKY